MGSDPVPLRSLAVATAGLVAIEGLARWAIVQRGIYPLTGIGLARLIDIAWMVLVISRSPRGWSQIGLVRAEWLLGLKKGFFWSAGFGILAAAGYMLLHLIGFDPMRILRPNPAVLLDKPALIYGVGGLIAPIAEEMYFRGLMFGFCRRWGFWPALFLSTLVFTLMHGGALGTAIPQLVGGIVFASAYEIEKSLLAPIAIHVLGNTAIFTLAFLI
jgi:uncharacterized protein